MVARTHHSQHSDPFSAALQPPANETAEQRQARLEVEQEQKRVSDQIDDDLRKERIDKKKRARREVRVLLLGQAESGKSTVLKNFRLKYALTQWKAELRSWRAVIQLNLVQNVMTILDAIQDHLAVQTETPNGIPYGRMSIDSTASAAAPSAHVHLTQKHRLLHLRLSPLRKVEEDLRRRLGAQDNLNLDSEFTFANGDDGAAIGIPPGRRSSPSSPRDFGVRGWIGALGLSAPGISRKSIEGQQQQQIDGATEILATLSEEIVALWEDADVRELLSARDIRLEDRPGFFLSDTARITNRTYVPSDNDVVRARLRTMGVQEWRILLENSDSFGSEWVIYDVGGSRSMRHAWLPYFDAVNAIIFLAPISCFDERLDEDSSVNRLEDTLQLWQTIVSSKLLSKTTLIVFLNKCDLLKRKLQNGVQVNKYMLSFGNRENEVGVVVKYLKDKFKDILLTEAPEPRTTYLYPTSVTDTKATAVTLNIVRDGIIREHLKHADLV